MTNGHGAEVAALVREVARPVSEDALLERVGDARIVLIGEASHGTREFYRVRADLTRRLIAERGFRAVAVEADWPDAFRVNRFVRGGEDSPGDALGDFTRFPRWMWRNDEVLRFAAWLRAHNDARTGTGDSGTCGFYGLDLYSLHRSMEAVVAYLERVDPEAASRARQRYACFEDFGEDPQAYGYVAGRTGSEPCEDAVVAQLVELLARGADFALHDGGPEELLFARENARLALDAERYYRAMFRGRDDSWNIRDTHMADTLDALLGHLGVAEGEPKVVVWAHNSHLGDARATEMGRRGELNLGQLARERHGGAVFTIGFSTHTGTVTAAHDWGEPARTRRVRPSSRGSYEALFHEVAAASGRPDFWLDLREDHPAVRALREERLQRAIGVIYRPDTERWSHYFHASLPDQFDALIHLDETTALAPLDDEAGNDGEVDEAADTFPRGV